nr:MAG TPA: hypothetical protein [Bacteriophage sp.]
MFHGVFGFFGVLVFYAFLCKIMHFHADLCAVFKIQ